MPRVTTRRTYPSRIRFWRQVSRRASVIAAGVIWVGPLLTLGLLAAGCSSLNFVKRRLPPPSQGPNGVTFRFFSPSARRVQLAGSWRDF